MFLFASVARFCRELSATPRLRVRPARRRRTRAPQRASERASAPCNCFVCKHKFNASGRACVRRVSILGADVLRRRNARTQTRPCTRCTRPPRGAKNTEFPLQRNDERARRSDGDTGDRDGAAEEREDRASACKIVEPSAPRRAPAAHTMLAYSETHFMHVFACAHPVFITLWPKRFRLRSRLNVDSM